MKEASVNWSEVTALFGGTFDPPHRGHLEAVRGLLRNPGVGRVILMPCGLPALKEATTSSFHRLQMLKSAFEKEQGSAIEISTLEIEQAEQNPGHPSYTVDSLERLRNQVRNLAFVVGSDQLAQMPRWHRFPELLELCHWIILYRKPDGMSEAQETLRRWSSQGIIESKTSNLQWKLRKGHVLIAVSTLAPAISSTEIREIFARTGTPPVEFLSPAVSEYLKLHGLYGTSRT